MSSTTINFFITLLCCFCFACIPSYTLAQFAVGMDSPILLGVEKPVFPSREPRTKSTYNRTFGDWGEEFAEKILRDSGYEVFEFKVGSNQGIDRYAFKRNWLGQIVDIRLVEVKTVRKSAPTPSPTKYGKQGSPEYIEEKIRELKNHSDPKARKVANEIEQFCKKSKKQLADLYQVFHINLDNLKLTTYANDFRTELSSFDIERNMKNLISKASNAERKAIAIKSLQTFDQMKALNQRSYLLDTGKQRARKSTAAKLTRKPPSGKVKSAIPDIKNKKATKKILAKVTGKAAGKALIFVGVALDAKEFFDIERAYRSGSISVRQRNIQHAAASGGLAGAIAGAATGAIAGSWAFGWGAIPGGIIGGVGGYFAGSIPSRYAANRWYDSIDDSVREKFELSWENGK